ncbi:BrnA antitoxin family protein [Treponema sp. OMZ 840]|uniref:BrnA antitoxin family protein n=1 Tax=Treponema sp. OMZ 840 TaxID=244313 RepID=UPI003D8BD389
MSITEAKHNLTKEKIEALQALNNKPVDTSDIPELTEADFMHMYRPVKKPLSIRLDADVILWLKSYGKGYQSRINAILREAMNSEQRETVL